MAEPLVVLVVEDEQGLQSILEETLSEGGFRTEFASSGEEALTLLSGSQGAYRVLVVDIRFGKDRIQGWDVARRARASTPDLPVIYITGGNADEWAVQGVPDSVLLTKPFAPAQLIAGVAQLLNTASTAARAS